MLDLRPWYGDMNIPHISACTCELLFVLVETIVWLSYTSHVYCKLNWVKQMHEKRWWKILDWVLYLHEVSFEKVYVVYIHFSEFLFIFRCMKNTLQFIYILTFNNLSKYLKHFKIYSSQIIIAHIDFQHFLSCAWLTLLEIKHFVEIEIF